MQLDHIDKMKAFQADPFKYIYDLLPETYLDDHKNVYFEPFRSVIEHIKTKYMARVTDVRVTYDKEYLVSFSKTYSRTIDIKIVIFFQNQILSIEEIAELEKFYIVCYSMRVELCI